ncbi:LysR family transcriptional regulator [Vibrio sp. Of7-15]|uniref:LysR family transcriptional regulator n=1 Tax=Vibrio sp. Of7-15 TaxID=2724879 RepID=UPI001EF19679|nr:LysR family transcriptional regulator [Vibrio sp. Of7-15]MCG7500112.1 LysR family transcriptional regulator [Vibrio sp. Of7-15]
MSARVTLEMWKTFIAIAEEGSAMKAAQALNKSQSAVCHSIKKMESLLGNSLFIVEGRKSILTDLGHSLLPRAQSLQSSALQIETLASKYQGHLMTEINIAVDVLLEFDFIHEVLERFNVVFPKVSIRVFETSLSGAGQLLSTGAVSLAIASRLPKETIMEPLVEVELRCVCSPDFPLADEEQIFQPELKRHRQVVIRDSGNQNIDSGWLGSHQRLTVSSLVMALTAIEKGQGFGWLPQHMVEKKIEQGTLVPVDLLKGATRMVRLQLGMSPNLAHIGEVNTLFDLFTSLKSMAHQPSFNTEQQR